MAAQELWTTTLFNDANLKAYYRMEGNSNDSKASNNGTDTSVTYSSTTGKFGQYGIYNGSARSNLGTGLGITNKISMSAWVNVTAFPTAGAIAALIEKKFDGTNEGYYLTLTESAGSVLLKAGCYNGSTHEASWTIAGWNTGEWHHIVGLYDGTNWKVFFDGVSKNTTANATGAIASTGETSLGAANINGSITRNFNGWLDDVSIWDRDLTQAEITSMNDGTLINRFGGETGYSFFM